MRALAEVGAIVQRAALGAGIPLGQAEDLARVAVYVAGSGADLAVVADALAVPQDPVEVWWDHDQMTVVAGPVALIAPIVRDAFAMGLTQVVLVDAGQVPLAVAMLAQEGVGVHLSGVAIMQDGAATPVVSRGPVQVSDAIWAVFERFAAKTYAPQSEVSRIAGAGAGLTDND